MLTHVIVPLDGSKLAQTALDHALNLLGTSGKITLVSVLQPPDVPIYDFYPVAVTTQGKDYESTFRESIVQAQSYLSRLASEIQADHPYQVSISVEIGDPAALIVERAQELHVDAIVMSTHGRSGVSRWLYGSVTQKVLSANCCPVFVIPAKLYAESAATESEKNNQTLPT